MKTLDFKCTVWTRLNVRPHAVAFSTATRFAKIFATVLAAFILLTGCGAGRVSSSEYYDNEEPQEEMFQLQDDCALLHIYRPGSMMGAIISYNLNLNEWVLCRVKNKSKTTVKVTEPGEYTLWAKTEATEEIPINIEMGKEYYIRCGVGMGIAVGRPEILIVDSQTGKYEYDKIKVKRK
jgi:hypothetical protein